MAVCAAAPDVMGLPYLPSVAEQVLFQILTKNHILQAIKILPQQAAIQRIKVTLSLKV